MKDICGTTGLACTRCNPSACEHRRYSSGYHVTDKLNSYMIKQRLTIRGMAGEKLIITDQATGEEYVVEDLGYPF